MKKCKSSPQTTRIIINKTEKQSTKDKVKYHTNNKKTEEQERYKEEAKKISRIIIQVKLDRETTMKQSKKEEISDSATLINQTPTKNQHLDQTNTHALKKSQQIQLIAIQIPYHHIKKHFRESLSLISIEKQLLIGVIVIDDRSRQTQYIYKKKALTPHHRQINA